MTSPFWLYPDGPKLRLVCQLCNPDLFDRSSHFLKIQAGVRVDTLLATYQHHLDTHHPEEPAASGQPAEAPRDNPALRSVTDDLQLLRATHPWRIHDSARAEGLLDVLPRGPRTVRPKDVPDVPDGGR